MVKYMDEINFLEKNIVDKNLEKQVEDLFGNDESIIVHNITYTMNELYLKMFDEIVKKTTLISIDEIIKYLDDIKSDYDFGLNKTKESIHSLLPKTLAFLKMMTAKTYEVLKYLSQNVGSTNEGKTGIKYEEMTKFTLLRIIHRSLEIMGEIITLIENGFVYGAEARWRVLNEYSVIAVVIASENDDELTERYINHEIIGSKKGAEKIDYYTKTEPSLYTKIKADYDTLEALYGKEYKNQYGWYKPNPNINFVDLATKYNFGNILGYVQIANFSNHGSSYLFTNFDLNDTKERINYLEPIVQNVVSSLNITVNNVIRLFLEEVDFLTIEAAVTLGFFNTCTEKIAELYFNERAMVDKNKPKYNELPPR